jgi:hypothetical protein
MPNKREKLIELPVADAILILKEELKQRTDGYTTYLANGGKGDPAEEVNLDALAMAISALEQKKWIPVTERLPEKWQHVLAASKCGDAYSIDFDHICSTGEWYGNLETEYKVTHWMPLPEAPKGE